MVQIPIEHAIIAILASILVQVSAIKKEIRKWLWKLVIAKKENDVQ